MLPAAQSGPIAVNDETRGPVKESVGVRSEVRNERSVHCSCMRGRLPSLTKNEQRVAVLIARGYSIRDIGTELGVEAVTARHYVTAVLDFMKQRARSEAGEGPRLTSREGQVVELLRRGATDREIADEIGVSLRTAEDHVYRIRRKFGLRSRHDFAGITSTDA